ncbi:MAG: acyl carrier protein [Candidatus Thiodubiliella endoseptemdiera]|uniref:Acyl carrier protein n=1 Tax=Candidatus Thiodubiliella endoseptemdiera TaxID=2738886 RepID=A0A853F112_9GAMM|nr:acyl carrier protein [Candidatus Thiodubiliella endoseptemdiera]
MEIIATIKKINTCDIHIKKEDDFMKKINLTSLDAVQLTVALNEKFDFQFGSERDDLDALNSFGGLIDLILDRAKKKPK